MTKVFRSVRFNIFLGAVITLASAMGTLIPQITETPEKVAQFQGVHPHWSRLFGFFNLFDVYHSYWFMGLLALMAVDIILCKLWSLPPDQGLVSLPPEETRELEAERHLAQKDAALKLKPYRADFKSAFPYNKAVEQAKKGLDQRGYAIQEDFFAQAGAAFVATRHRAQRWGSYLAHIALVTILLGALIRAVFGFVEMVPVIEGGSRAMQNKPDWNLFVDKFDIKYYPGTRDPSSYASALRVESRGKLLAQKTIHVNDPLDIGGVRFYQASWGAGGMFRSATLKFGDSVIRLPQRVLKKIPGTPLSVEADVMLPDFTVDQDGQADTGSLELKDPAVRVFFQMGPHKTRPIWLLQKFPNISFVENDDGILEHILRPPFRLVDVDPVLFSGIQVAYDPGFKIVLAGAILWLAGMIMLFYLHRRRLWVLVEPDGRASRVCVGGWSSRGPREFEAEFAALMGELRGGMEPRSDLLISRQVPAP
ncbi:MAG: cytochrome c biogenesis protein ResB [Elusimicrobia bacterium]|nr:cytochrome c biogenesis protein ResB [Elusimicrobiota bacterium]MDE2236509.1 cytochrome c biogenesis protein ResB [Elusimicrobiota bacterium]MDE2424976.1 cytochrome c biogenesis protein ResB [Elusimicrobiota bacterium]